MSNHRPPASPELVTVGVVPVQSFVSPAVAVPPGTPARPRPDRPPLAASEQPNGPDRPANNEAGSNADRQAPSSHPPAEDDG